MSTRVRDKDRGAAALRAKLKAIKNARVTIGIHANKGDEAHEGAQATVLDVAIRNEFGLGVPERPFLRGWFDANTEEQKRIIVAMVGSIIKNGRTPQQAFEIIGQRFQGEIQKWIADGSHVAPNAASTILMKGSSTPLVDTGQLRSSVTYEVKKA